MTITLTGELARMTAYFQLRTIATQMGADPDSVDASALNLTISNSAAGYSPRPSAADSRADDLNTPGHRRGFPSSEAAK